MSPSAILDILERAKGSVRVGDHEEAERLLKSYLSKNPESREAHLLLGTTLAKENKLPEAEDEFNILLGKNPQDIEALNNIAVVYRLQGKLQDALAVLVEAIDLEPAKVEFHYNIGNIHKQLGNLKAASMSYAKVVELDPHYVPAYNNLGTIYEQLKEYDKAFAVFRKGLALDRNNPTLHFNYGVALEANGLLKEAAEEYQSSIRSKPGWLDPQNNLGIILFKQGQHSKALTIFNRILSADPLNSEARNNMGVVLMDQGRTKEAIQNYRQAIASDPQYIKAVVNLERALEQSGDLTDAIVELEKLIKLSPNNAEVRTRLGGLYLKMERYPETLIEAAAALEWEPENIHALKLKGTALRFMGKDEEARAIFEKILSLDPGNYSFHLDLADIHFKRKEYQEAEKRITAFLTRRPNDRGAKILLGKLYGEMGNTTHALQIFEELARADPSDTEALAAAAELQKDAGALEKALRTADTLVNLQGKRATADDLSELNKSLEFYEHAVSAYSSSVRDMWDRNIKLALGAAETGPETDEDMALLLGAAGMAAAMDEETETLFIEDAESSEEFIEEEDLEPPEEPLPLYHEEDTAIENMADHFSPMPQIVPPPPQSQPPAQNPPHGQPPEQGPQNPPPPQSPPPPQASPPPQNPPPPPPQGPWPPYPSYPAYPPYPPREAPLEEEEPFPGTAPDDGPEALPFDDEPEEIPGSGENPEDEEDGVQEDLPESPPEENIFDEEEPEDFSEPKPEDYPEPEPDESGPPAEPLPEEESSSESREAPPPPEPPPASSETGESPEPEAPADGEAKKDPAETKDLMLGLMNYLKNLAKALPDKERNAFMESDARLRIEHIITTLKGQRGLIKIVEERRAGSPPPDTASSAASGPLPFSGKMAALRAASDAAEGPKKRRKPDLPGMLSFMAKLAGALPDQSLGIAISRKVGKVLSGIKQSGKHNGEKA
jgi:tetratricopeptide (TPR) repeat protein